MPPVNLPAQLQLAAKAQREGRLSEAEKIYRQLLALHPDNPAVLHGLGTLAMKAHRPDAAIHLLRRAVELNPASASAWNDLSVAAGAMRLWHEALSAAQRAVAIDPNLAPGYFNLAGALCEVSRSTEAIAAYRQTIALNPDHAIAHSNLSALLCDKGNPQAAVEEARKAIRLKPDFGQAYINLGVALGDLGEFDQAIHAMRRATELQPDLAEPQFNLGNFFKNQHRYNEAIAAYRRAIALKPQSSSGVHNNLAEVFKNLGQIDQSLEIYKQALEIAPSDSVHHSNLIYTSLFSHYDSQTILREAKDWNHRHALPLKHLISLHENDANADRKLRIGYVSPDFRDHVVGRNMLPLFRHHDHAKFEISIFSNLPHPDEKTEQFRKLADHFHDIASLNDDSLAELIRQNQIDILIDLTLHMGGNRLLAFARKPAPIQITFAGYPGTTGLSTIDYRLTDPYLDPPGMGDENYSETSVRLPHTFWCYEPLAAASINDLPAARNGAVTFGCLNNFCKVNPNVLTLWSSVLLEIPNSRLLLMCPADAQPRVLETFQLAGIPVQRISFVSFQQPVDYLKTYHQIDIILDTFPYNGHTTNLDALWMGVPVITLVGNTVVGRAGLSQLSNLDLNKLVAFTHEQYIQIAKTLAADLNELAHLRSMLRTRMERSPLMDAAGFARAIESAYRFMWKTWCAERQHEHAR